MNVMHAASELVNDLEMIFRDGSRHVLKGKRHIQLSEPGYTYNLPAEGFRHWLEDMREFGPVKIGDIRAHEGEAPDEPKEGVDDQAKLDQLADMIDQKVPA